MNDRNIHAETMTLLDGLYRALDGGDPERLVACFTPDAVWDRPDGPKSGHAAISTVATDRAGDRKTSHVPSNLVVEDQGGALNATYYLTVYVAQAGAPAQLLVLLDCVDRIILTEAGLRVTEKRTSLRMKFA